MRVYADSSFIVSIYVQRVQTEAALRQWEALNAAGESVCLGDLAFLEVTNAVQLGVFRGSFSAKLALEVLNNFNSDVRAGIFRLIPAPPLLWKKAAELSTLHGANLGCRSLAVLQVANALLLNSELFLTFDQRQWALAIAVGLNAPDLSLPAYS